MKIIIIVTTNHENMALMKRGKQYLCVVHHSFVNIFANVKNPVRKEGSILLEQFLNGKSEAEGNSES